MNLKLNITDHLTRASALALALLSAACTGLRGESADTRPLAAAEAGASQLGCAPVERQLSAMGTELGMTIWAPTRAAGLAASELAVRALEATEARLSTWRADSELSRLNASAVGEWIELSSATTGELRDAIEFAIESGSAFAPTCGALIDAWDLRGDGDVPTAVALAVAREASKLITLELDGARARRTHPDLRIDAGAWGKGAGLDAAVAALETTPDVSGWIDLGGQLARFGNGASPSVSVAHPLQRESPAVELTLERRSVATTGNSERGALGPDADIGHILDPRSGRPADDFGSLTVIADSALLADAMATGLFVLGPREALARAERDERFDVLVLETTPAGGVVAKCNEALVPLVRVVADDIRLRSNVLPSR